MAIAKDSSGNSPIGFRVETHIAEPGGAGGGGDASAANQVLANTKLDTLATKLDSVITNVDGLETNTASTNTKLDTMITAAQSTATINVAADTANVFDGTTMVPVKRVLVQASTSGNNTIIAAVSGKRFRILSYNLIANGAVNGKFQTGASGTDETGLMYCAAAGDGMVADFNEGGWFETRTANTLLNLNLSAAIAVGGVLTYIEVT